MLIAASTSTNNFILPNATIIVEVVLFVITIGIVNTFVLKPVQRVIAERESTVRASINAGDEANSEAADLERQRFNLLDGARQEARTMLEEATREAEATRAAARDAGHQEYDRLVAAALSEIESQRDSVRAELLGRAGTLVRDAAERVAGISVDVAHSQHLLEAAMTAAESNRSA